MSNKSAKNARRSIHTIIDTNKKGRKTSKVTNKISTARADTLPVSTATTSNREIPIDNTASVIPIPSSPEFQEPSFPSSDFDVYGSDHFNETEAFPSPEIPKKRTKVSTSLKVFNLLIYISIRRLLRKPGFEFVNIFLIGSSYTMDLGLLSMDWSVVDADDDCQAAERMLCDVAFHVSTPHSYANRVLFESTRILLSIGQRYTF